MAGPGNYESAPGYGISRPDPIPAVAHWTDQKIAVHAWCCVLGYLLARFVHLRLAEHIGYAGTLHTMMEDLNQIRRATVLRKQPHKPGRPRLETVLDHPDDPHFYELTGALGLRP